ncbi:Pathogenesis-related protein (modular protein) [uncultured Alphaproteobacteria bacterium]|uniref:Pathogenesis-related protein (Modular protein) n=1 Tax=uncultured Alphaproteobacteria bacterium TaxID=91750 RepID=A0A212JZR2_9PROT|nr:Pathogenesis-related protein (modular protein) [uncultured Alphaproteobacteria bacterium]
MHLHSYRLRNFRRLRDVHVELASDISIFVGANNSGKTSATQAMQMFLSGGKDAFSLYDFSSHVWQLLDEIGEREGEVAEAEFPTASLDVWFEVGAEDLYLVIPILPSTAWAGTLVGVRVELAPKNSAELIQRYRAARDDGRAKAAALPGGAGNYVPWPKSLSDYLLKELRREYELNYFVLDHTQFDAKFQPMEGYQPLPLGDEPGGAAVLKSLIKVDFLNAQRHLADPSTMSGGGRSEDLSKRLSRFYQRNLDQRQDDHQALKALFESEIGLDKHLAEVFKDTLERLGHLGYPGLNNPKLEIRSALNPASIMTQDARVHYIVGEGAQTITLPDTYNGLGFKNLIYMVVEVLDLQERWKAEEEKRAPLHLIFIEEPEAHLHAQLQQVFIRNILDLLIIPGEAEGAFTSQAVITTHSPHILYERGFQPIRYFRRNLVGSDQVTEVLNLSTFYAQETEHRDFLQRYLKLTHCDLFFSDAAVLVEGNVERLLLPIMISKVATSLRSSCICILEVGGAFGHKFRSLIEFLGIVTLIITDVDSVILLPANHDGDDDDELEVEVEAPETEAVDGSEVSPEAGAPPATSGEVPAPAPICRYAKKCLPSVAGAVTSNQTLVKWLPARQSINALFEATEQEKETLVNGTTRIRVAYQTPVTIVWNSHNAELAGRTLEEAFGLENAEWCQSVEQRKLGLRLRGALADPAALAAGLHKRVSGDKFDKTKFALGVLTARPEEWQVPAYIRDGLTWLKAQIDLEVEAEVEGVKVGE